MRYFLALIALLVTTGLFSQQSLLIKNVYVVDVVNATTSKKPQDLLIEGKTIKKIGPTGTINPQENTQIHQAKGAYVIPGMWDMHAHPDDPEVWRFNPQNNQKTQLMPQFVLHGVTGIRDMAGDMTLINEWRDKIKSGALLGPQIVAGGPLLDGPNPMWDGSVGINDVNAVGHIADSLIASGVDFLKVYSLLPRDIYLALQAYANEKGYTVAGHVPLDVKPSEATLAGIDCQEHFLEILNEVSSKTEDIKAGKIDYGSATSRRDQSLIRKNLILDSYDPQKASKLYRLFAEKGTWHTPTISMWYKNAWYEEEVKKDAALFEYLPKYLETYWKSYEVNDHLQNRLKPVLQYKQKEAAKYMEMIKEMHDAGVKLLAGTDVGANPLCWPGIGVHNELKLMVKAGLSPAQALQTATINPAIYLNLNNQQGTIEAGKLANMVLLKQNPIDNINALDGIEAVVNQGQLIDQTTRQLALNEIKAYIGN